MISYLRSIGFVCHRLAVPAKGDPPATPDYLCVRLAPQPGGSHVQQLFYFHPNVKLRASQKIWIAQRRVEGWPVCVAETIPDLQKFLSNHNFIQRKITCSQPQQLALS